MKTQTLIAGLIIFFLTLITISLLDKEKPEITKPAQQEQPDYIWFEDSKDGR